MPEPLTPRKLCGQLIVGGFDGDDVPADVRQSLAQGELGGLILFKRNLPTVDAAHAICMAAAAAAPDDLPPLLGVDQEGGRVVRLPEAVLRLPPLRVFGKIGDPELVRRAAELVGLQLAALGFNMNFTPVLDVDSNPNNPIIGDRAFSSDPDSVGRLGRAFIEGLQAAGVMACGKHYPGHGDTIKDSHFDLPLVAHDKQRLDAVELPPFRIASLRGVAALMTAHVVYSGLDPGVPATLSHRICTGLLRSEIGFSGVLFSDDLEMKALADHYEIEQSAIQAIRAGCDVLLICHDLELQERARAALAARAEADSDFRTRCQQAFSRFIQARRRCPPRPKKSSDALQAVLADRGASELLAAIDERLP